MKRSVYEFEQKVREMWEDKDSLAAYPFGRHYGGVLSKPFAVNENSIIYMVYYGRVERQHFEAILGNGYYNKLWEMTIAVLYEYHFDTGEEQQIYEAVDMTDGGSPLLNDYRPRYEREMRIFRNNKGQLFIKLCMAEPGYIHDEIYTLQPYRTWEWTNSGKKVTGFTGWHRILVGPGFPGFAKGKRSFGKQVDDETVFDAINNMSMDFYNPDLVTWMP